MLRLHFEMQVGDGVIIDEIIAVEWMVSHKETSIKLREHEGARRRISTSNPKHSPKPRPSTLIHQSIIVGDRLQKSADGQKCLALQTFFKV